MEGYKCDWCKRFHTGEPIISIELLYKAFGMAENLHFDTWECLSLFAQDRAKRQ